MKFYTKILLSILLTVTVIFAFTGISCTLTPQGIQVLSGDYTCPKLVSFNLTSENDALVSFSRPVEFEKLSISSSSSTSGTSSTNGTNETEEISVKSTAISEGTYLLTFENDLDCRNLYTLEGNVKDLHGNTLYFKDTFQGYNSRIPEIRLNEIRTEYTKPKCEFIELLVLSDGNLGGMELLSAVDGKEKSYIFPPVEVKSGEYVVVHFRKIEDGEIDELEDDCTVSGGTEAGSWRDLWVENTSARIGKSDVILLRERIDGPIVDCVLFAESTTSSWKNDFVAECAKEAFESGKWESSSGSDYSPSCAVCSDGLTVTRTLSRIGDGNSAQDWIVVASSNCTLGYENSKKAYSSVTK